MATFPPRGYQSRRPPRIRENVNEAIRAREVRAIFPDGTVEIMPTSAAIRRAQELGLDMNRFKATLASGKYRARIQEDDAQAAKLGIDGTPTMLVNGEQVVGAVPFENLKAVIDRQLASAKK